VVDDVVGFIPYSTQIFLQFSSMVTREFPSDASGV